MNPYRCSGPDFLLFYSVLGFAVIALVCWKNRGAGSAAASGDVNLTDPYEIAYLRGGALETITVAIVKLLQARVLQPGPLNLVETTDPATPVQTANPLDASIAEFARRPVGPDTTATHAPIQTLADTYCAGLEARGLLNSGVARDAAKWRIGIARQFSEGWRRPGWRKASPTGSRCYSWRWSLCS